MRKLLLGSAVTVMLAAGGVADVDAWSLTENSRSDVKSPAGWNNSNSKKALRDYYGDESYVEDAKTARAIVKNFIAGLKAFETKNRVYTSKVDACVKALEKIVDAALESIQRCRKTADTVPDCGDAVAALKSTQRLVREVIKAGKVDSFPEFITEWPKAPPRRSDELSNAISTFYNTAGKIGADIAQAKERENDEAADLQAQIEAVEAQQAKAKADEETKRAKRAEEAKKEAEAAAQAEKARQEEEALKAEIAAMEAQQKEKAEEEARAEEEAQSAKKAEEAERARRAAEEAEKARQQTEALKAEIEALRTKLAEEEATAKAQKAKQEEEARKEAEAAEEAKKAKQKEEALEAELAALKAKQAEKTEKEAKAAAEAEKAKLAEEAQKAKLAEEAQKAKLAETTAKATGKRTAGRR
ncbi:hypothetical protein FACS189449_06360 [Alphaproteobacteria bacterium]|nr:hypothetical protein FACS189449_06360 [Alphaproteobacteria bacterium]